MSKKMKFLFLALALVAMPSGCGKAPDPASVTAQTTTGTLTPAWGITGSCATQAYSSDFATNCQACFGGSITTANGAKVCRIYSHLSATPYPTSYALNYPVLTPEDPAAAMAWPVYASSGMYPVTLKKGFTLSYTGTGGWDYNYAWYGTTCSKVHLDGTKDGVPYVTAANGLGSALYGSDGTQTFLMGSSVSNHVIQADGVLRVGFNVDPVQITKACSPSIWMNLTIIGCLDTSYNSVACQ
jgi:hypothetical protein